jgi:hypothetical protein
LPKGVQRLARQKYALWQSDAKHHSLHFKLLKGHKNLGSVRIGDHHRALGSFEGADFFIWTWIGTHEQYNKLVKQ